MDFKILYITCSKFLSDVTPQKGKQKKKNKQMGPYQIKKVLQSKGNYQQNKNTTHRI